MDANQSVQDGREGEADDVVDDGEGGGVILEGQADDVVEGGRAGVSDGAPVGGGDGAVVGGGDGAVALQFKIRQSA